MIINIFKMAHENAMYGDVLGDDHMPWDTFDRFYIFASGRIELNSGGTAHTEAELDRVREMIAREHRIV